jgi:hypothetical protein
MPTLVESFKLADSANFGVLYKDSWSTQQPGPCRMCYAGSRVAEPTLTLYITPGHKPLSGALGTAVDTDIVVFLQCTAEQSGVKHSITLHVLLLSTMHNLPNFDVCCLLLRLNAAKSFCCSLLPWQSMQSIA